MVHCLSKFSSNFHIMAHKNPPERFQTDKFMLI
nr:MAG TPA: hypothetical protein [Caudoviricetes sp.]